MHIKLLNNLLNELCGASKGLLELVWKQLIMQNSFD